jgi:glycine/D-amino acid oxidase-like deaminating enzyme
MQRALIIGGGVVGLSIAAGLQRVGIAVTAVDAAPANGPASWGNAGHIAIEQAEPLASWPVLRSAPGRLFCRGGALALPPSQIRRWLPFVLRMASAARPARVTSGRAALRSLLVNALPAWRSLSEHIGAPALVRETGHYVVWESSATAAAGLAAWRSADTGSARFHECTADELQAIAGIMKRSPAGAIRFENTAQIADLSKLAEALRTSISARNGSILSAKARRVIHRPGSVSVTLESGESMQADFAVIAAGVRSGELLQPYCNHLPLIAERGYHIQMQEHRWPDLPPVVFEDRSMIVTRFESGLRAASFLEFSSPDAPADERKWRRLRAHVTELGLPCGAPVQQWMGARPTLPDYLPAIGRLSQAPNILYAFGHQHLGLTLAAITSDLIAQLALGRSPGMSLASFDIQRFSRRKSIAAGEGRNLHD